VLGMAIAATLLPYAFLPCMVSEPDFELGGNFHMTGETPDIKALSGVAGAAR